VRGGVSGAKPLKYVLVLMAVIEDLLGRRLRLGDELLKGKLTFTKKVPDSFQVVFGGNPKRGAVRNLPP